MVMEVVDGMKLSRLRPSLATFNMLMEIACASAKDPSTVCLELLREMKYLGVVPSLGSYYYVLFSHQKKEKKTISVGHTLLPNILNELRGGGADLLKIRHASDRRFFDYAMNISKPFPSNAKALYDIVQDEQLGDLIRPADFYAYYLSAIAVDEPKWDTIIQIYEKFFKNRYVPKPLLYQNLFDAMRYSDNVAHLPYIFKDFARYHLPSREENYPSLVVGAMFAALEKSTIPVDQLDEYLALAVEADSFIAKKDASRESLLVRLMCNCNRYADAKSKVEKCEQDGIVLKPEVVKLFSLLSASRPKLS